MTAEAIGRQVRRALGRPTGRRFDRSLLQDVLEYYEQQSGLTVVVERDTNPFVSLRAPELTLGTSLAYLLHDVGLSFTVRVADEEAHLLVLPGDSCSDPWPVGWPAKQFFPELRESGIDRWPVAWLRRLAPTMRETVPVELVNAEVDRVLAGVEEKTGVPLLIDRPALARAKIDLSKLRINYSSKSATWAHILGHALAFPGLQSEVRVDEAGKLFLWITATSD